MGDSDRGVRGYPLTRLAGSMQTWRQGLWFADFGYKTLSAFDMRKDHLARLFRHHALQKTNPGHWRGPATLYAAMVFPGRLFAPCLATPALQTDIVSARNHPTGVSAPLVNAAI